MRNDTNNLPNLLQLHIRYETHLFQQEFPDNAWDCWWNMCFGICIISLRFRFDGRWTLWILYLLLVNQNRYFCYIKSVACNNFQYYIQHLMNFLHHLGFVFPMSLVQCILGVNILLSKVKHYFSSTEMIHFLIPRSLLNWFLFGSRSCLLSRPVLWCFPSFLAQVLPVYFVKPLPITDSAKHAFNKPCLLCERKTCIDMFFVRGANLKVAIKIWQSCKMRKCENQN